MSLLYSLEPVARYLSRSNNPVNSQSRPDQYASQGPYSKAQQQNDEPSNFFTNPRGEYDSRRAQLADDYRKEIQKASQEREKISRRGRILEKEDSYMPNTQNREARPYPVQESTAFRRDENQFPKQFGSQDSGYQPNGYSLEGMQYQNASIPYQNFSQPSQYQTSKKPEAKQESSEEYFPFGRPGAGAPMRDSQGRIVTKRPAGFTNNKGDPAGTIKFEKQYESSMYQDKRETLKDDWRKALNDQMIEKKKKTEEDKARKLLEERIEEAKIMREQKELEKKFRHEIKYERGEVATPSDKTERTSQVVFQDAKKPETTQPVVTQPNPPKEINNEPRPRQRELDVWQSRGELVGQHSALKDIIEKLKSEASRSNVERMDALNELDKLKEELRQRSLVTAQKNQFSIAQAFRPYYYSQPILETKPNFAPSNSYHISSNSEFIPFQNSSAPVSVKRNMSGYQLSKPSVKNDYSYIKSAEVKNQLENLDLLINYTLAPSPIQPEPIIDSFTESKEREMDSRSDFKEL
ncbi:unnamed protein product [Blepharisma stoltei]|uniref:Uncharacterized protein n=1 Tax=Blepharisma stoltei TaxID=1481888 RepID=A0AAU9JDF6_9CILI|nr:unnamed protein product [Blepharisma stoltei]